MKNFQSFRIEILSVKAIAVDYFTLICTRARTCIAVLSATSNVEENQWDGEEILDAPEDFDFIGVCRT
jgi:hypothetical protein